MQKLLVQTTGSFQLMDPEYNYQRARHNRPSVVMSTNFINSRIAIGQVKLLSQVSDEATDEEFDNYLRESDGDVALAIQSFLAAYAPEPVVEEGEGEEGGEEGGEEKPKRGRGKSKAE